MRKVLLMIAIFVFVFGCGKKEEVEEGTDTGEHGMHREEMLHYASPEQRHEMGKKIQAKNKTESGIKIRKAGKNEIGKQVTCPVMGTKFKVKEFTEAADYKGESYYFCCNACPPEFKKNPEKYTK